MKRFRPLAFFLVIFMVTTAEDCGSRATTSDDVQRKQQETILAEGTAQVGMPAIKNFRERKLMKDIIELRDQVGLTTWTYLASEMTGKVGDLLCSSIGYPVPYSTQFTNPEKVVIDNAYGQLALPQADPNGLFSPSSADASWVMCKDPRSERVAAVYSEPKLIVSPFPLK